MAPRLRPDPDHDAVCGSTARHLVVVAPPGTGKTCLAVRLASEVAPGLGPWSRVLVLTFSNQARIQLEREAARQLVPGLRNRVEISNYHRFFWHAVRAYRRALGLPERLDIGSRRRRTEALRRVDPQLVTRIGRIEGLIDGLAELRFSEFRDARTPGLDELAELLPVVEAEQRAGRLVFDDLGALFWTLLERFPSVTRALQQRYPVVVADEHQDASGLQDAVVRRLATQRLIILADPMQLIHGFRGADPERLKRHEAECDEQIALRTPHRWHAAPQVASWLLAVRERLNGHAVTADTPALLQIEYTNAAHGFNRMKFVTKEASARLLAGAAASVAVLAPTNRQVADLRDYLSRSGLFPRQVGGGVDFEEGRDEVEQLPLLPDPQAAAHYAVDRLQQLVPTLRSAVARQVKDRLLPEEIRVAGAGPEARLLLRALSPIYTYGTAGYFAAIVAALDACGSAGHHLPRTEAIRPLRATADAIGGGASVIDDAVQAYAERLIASSHSASRAARGLQVMTVHQAKGKEFDSVVLVDVSTRHFPDDDERRRLFYVAITRATTAWVIVAPDRDASPLIRHLT